MSNKIIIVKELKEKGKAILTLYDKLNIIFETEAFIGKNGMTTNKVEGDGKTPKGVFSIITRGHFYRGVE